MMEAAFDMPHFLGPFARNAPPEETPPAEIPPERATEIVKSLALHNGAAVSYTHLTLPTN